MVLPKSAKDSRKASSLTVQKAISKIEFEWSHLVQESLLIEAFGEQSGVYVKMEKAQDLVNLRVRGTSRSGQSFLELGVEGVGEVSGCVHLPSATTPQLSYSEYGI